MRQRLFIILPALAAAVSMRADNWIREAEPARLRVHYIRTEVYDTTRRGSHFRKDPVMLLIGEHKSAFYGTKRLWLDSISAVDPSAFQEYYITRLTTDMRDNPQPVSGNYWSYVYKNIPEGKVTERCYFDLENWQYTENWEKPEWNLSDESKDVLGYQCFKAVADYRGRRWTAWFAPEIPVHDGPWKLCGLPGLILEAYDEDRHYQFDADGLELAPECEVGMFTYDEERGITTVTRDKFFNNWWKFQHSDFVAKMAAAYGVKPKAIPEDNSPKTVRFDKEETDYPHD